MKAIITSYRRGRRTQKGNQMIILPEKTENSSELIGKKVVFKTNKKEIIGTITATHGNKGALRVIFEKGMPGQALFKEIEIKE